MTSLKGFCANFTEKSSYCKFLREIWRGLSIFHLFHHCLWITRIQFRAIHKQTKQKRRWNWWTIGWRFWLALLNNCKIPYKNFRARDLFVKVAGCRPANLLKNETPTTWSRNFSEQLLFVTPLVIASWNKDFSKANVNAA